MYVDDILVTGSNKSFINQFICKLDTTFSFKDLGSLNYFLGIEVHRSKFGMHLSPTAYINDHLQKTNMLDYKMSPLPTSSTVQLAATSNNSFFDGFLYHSIICMLQYLTITRPEISFAVNKLSQYMYQLSELHWSACKRIIRYLQGTKHFGLLLHPSNHLKLIGFTDTDWTSNLDDHKSTGGYDIYPRDFLVSWSSKNKML